MSKAPICTTREAIRALGGRAKVAAWLKVSQSAISNWAIYGHIARGKELQVLLSLWARGHQVSPKLFGVSSWDELIMPKAQTSKATSRPGSPDIASASMMKREIFCDRG